MTNQDKKRFAEIMAGLAEVFTNHPISKEKAELYFRTFQNWTIEDFEKACLKVIKTKTISTFPLPAEIENALKDTTEVLKAWLLSREAVSRWGAYMSIRFPNPIIHSVIEAMGGWIPFCHIPQEELKWKQKEFERIYPLMQQKTKHPQWVCGIHEINSLCGGHKEVSTTTLIDFEIENEEVKEIPYMPIKGEFR